MSHTLYPAAACLTDWQQCHYAGTCLGKLSNTTQMCMLGEGRDQMSYHPAAASNIFEMTSASIDCVLLFSCRLYIAALTPALILMYISAHCHTLQAAACPILLSTFKAFLAPQFMTLNIMSCLQWVMQLVTGGSEEQLGEMAAQAERDVDSLIAMYAQVHSFPFYQH